MQQPNSVCVLRLSALGDCINAFGVLGAIHKEYPQVKLNWIIDKRFAPLFCDEQSHQIIPMACLNFQQQGLWSCFTLKKELQKLGSSSFDVLLNMQTSLKASLSSLFVKAHDKYGYDQQRSREGQRFFVNHQIASSPNPHVLAGFMEFAKSCNLPISNPYWNFKLDPYLIDRVKCTISHEQICVINPCSAKVQKNWHIKGYVTLAEYAKYKGMSVILVGGKNELEVSTCNEIANQVPNIINLCGKTSLRELAAYLSIAKIVIAPDSACMHLASALNTPVIGLFAVHNPLRVGPWNFMHLNVSVYEQLAKQELAKEKGIKNLEQIEKLEPLAWRYRVKDPQAMEHISIEQVIQKFDEAYLQYIKQNKNKTKTTLDIK